MSKYDRGRRPYVKPVTKIELSEKHTKLRWIAVIVLLSIGAVAIGMSLFSALNTQPGWQEIEVVSDRPNCSTEFTFLYDFSDYGNSATAANKTLVKVYSTATEEAHCIFSKDMEDAGIANLYYVNANPNKTVQVEPALYQAFSLLESYGS